MRPPMRRVVEWKAAHGWVYSLLLDCGHPKDMEDWQPSRMTRCRKCQDEMDRQARARRPIAVLGSRVMEQ